MEKVARCWNESSAGKSLALERIQCRNYSGAGINPVLKPFLEKRRRLRKIHTTFSSWES